MTTRLNSVSATFSAILSASLLSLPVWADCQADYTKVSIIQGTAQLSPLVGQQVVTRGVVTAVLYAGSRDAGIVLRELPKDTATPQAGSDSLFVADAAAAERFTPGQIIQLSGTVSEADSLTHLSQITNVSLCAGKIAPEPYLLTLPLSTELNWEMLENRWLRIEQSLIVTDSYGLGRYGEMTLADKRLITATEIMLPGAAAVALSDQQQQRQMLVLDDGKNKQNPEPIRTAGTIVTAERSIRVGDTVSAVEGVLLQDERGYRLVPTAQAKYSATNPRPSAPEPKPAKALRIASFNVLNFFNGSDQPNRFPTRRGASSEAELSRQQAKTVAALAALDADVIGLLEVENNGYGQQSALATLTAALNQVAKQPYRFIITSAAPGTDAIKTALLYRPSTVAVEGKAALLSSEPFNWGSRPPLAQSFRHLASAQIVTVSINHFKSKGSCPENGNAADADQQDGQGCWNALRTKSAKALSDWLATSPTGVKTDKQIILGDLNAYRLEDPVTVLEQQQWQYLGPRSGSYSYVFRGRSGTLDHALASKGLARHLSNVQHWAINADEPAVLDYNMEYKSPKAQQSLYAPNPYRSSDHDPLIATFTF